MQSSSKKFPSKERRASSPMYTCITSTPDGVIYTNVDLGHSVHSVASFDKNSWILQNANLREGLLGNTVT